MIQFQDNVETDGRTDGQKDRLFYRAVPATARGPIRYLDKNKQQGILCSEAFYVKHIYGQSKIAYLQTVTSKSQSHRN